MEVDTNNTTVSKEGGFYGSPAGISTIGIIAVLTASGNCLFILLYCTNHRARAYISPLLLNLSVVDLCNGLVSLPLSLRFPRSSSVNVPPDDEVWCVITTSIPVVVFTEGLLTVLLITVERFITILQPLAYTTGLHWRHITPMIITSWCLSLLVAFWPGFGVHTPDDIDILVYCNGRYRSTFQYAVIYPIFLYIIPLLVIILLYMMMYRIARRHQQAMTNQVMSSQINDVTTTTQWKGISKAAKTSFILCCFYIVCWVPFITSINVYTICQSGLCGKWTIDIGSFIVVTMLTYLNSALNPVIYIVKHRVLKREVRKMFRLQVRVEHGTSTICDSETQQ